MKLQEISNLIQIRNYVSSAINNFSIDKKVIKELNNTLILLDRRITEELVSDVFKEHIGFDPVGNPNQIREVITNAIMVNDIKKNMNPLR